MSIPLSNEKDPDPEAAALAKLATISPPTSSGPVIAVDLDDVLSQTNQSVSDWYNENYPGAQMSPANFYYYYYWKNPYWGTPAETFLKVKQYYSTDCIYQSRPVPGAREGIQALRDLGYRLIIVTARTRNTHGKSWEWVEKYFPGLFDSVICTGQFEDADLSKPGHELVTKLTKQQVCLDLGAKLLIDDSLDNALACVSHTPPIPVLLFGDYEWNKRQSFASDNRDEMTFAYRLEKEGEEFWKKDDAKVVYPEGAPLRRVKDWGEAIRWISQARKDGAL